MKKLVTLALAGICAMAFAATIDTADAASAMRSKAHVYKQSTTAPKVVGSGTIQLNHVTTGYSGCAQDYAAAQGGYFIVDSIWSDSLLNSQSVYDDIKTALTGTYKNIFPSIAQEQTYVHVGQIRSGNSGYNANVNPADWRYSSVSNIAHYVIPGRVASLGVTNGGGVNTAALNDTNSNVPKFKTQAEADAYIAKVKSQFENNKSTNESLIANKITQIKSIYNKFLNEQAAALAIVQNDYDSKANILAQAEAAYTAATNAKNTALTSYNNKKNVKALEDAYADAQELTAAALADKNSAIDTAAAAKNAYDEAVANLNGFDYDGQVADLDAVRQAGIAAAEADLQAAYDAALVAKNAAEDAYNDAQKPTVHKEVQVQKVEDEDGNIVEQEVEVDVEVPADEAVVAAAFERLNAAKGALHTATINLRTGVDSTSFDNAYNGGVGALDAQLRALQGSVANANANLNAAVAAKNAAVNAYNDAVAAEAAAKTALDNAKSARTNAWKVYQDKIAAEEAAKAARDTAKANADAAAKALADLKVAQANAKAAKIAELNASLSTYISNMIRDYQNKPYALSQIVGLNSFSVDGNVTHLVINASFVEPEVAVTGENKATNSFDSVVAVHYDAEQYAMVDGTLTKVTTVSSDLYRTTIYAQNGSKYISPLVLDMTGNGQLQASNGQHMPGHSTVLTNNIVADFFGDGFEIAMEWVGPEDGLLVAPKADGSVDMSCLFGTAGGYETGYEKLSLYDKNGDMKITGDELNALSIWQDANRNGIAEAGEVKTVNSLGITSINVEFNKDNFISSFERNGQTYKMWDWWPNAVELITVAAK